MDYYEEKYNEIVEERNDLIEKIKILKYAFNGLYSENEELKKKADDNDMYKRLYEMVRKEFDIFKKDICEEFNKQTKELEGFDVSDGTKNDNEG